MMYFSLRTFDETCYQFAFEGSKVDIFLGTTYYGFGFISDGLMVLDIDYSSSNNVNESFSLITTNENVCNNSGRWHVRLAQIGQDRMNRLARESLLGPLTKVSIPTCKHCLASKAVRKPFNEAKRVFFFHFN